MTTLIYAKGDTARRILRRNYAPNPGPFLPGYPPPGWVGSPGEDTAYVPNDGGLPAVQVADLAGSGGPYCRPDINMAPGVGYWVGASFEIKALDNVTAANMRVTLAAYDGASITGEATAEPVPTTLYERVSNVRQVTAMPSGGRVNAFVWPAPGSTAPNNGFRTRRAMVMQASSRSELEAHLAGGYFDGDTPDGFGLRYDWVNNDYLAGSIEWTPANALQPTLVTPYAHERRTNNTVLYPMSGAPVVVSTGAPSPLSGTFEFLCGTQQLALDVADLCDGSREVSLESTWMPEAPFDFTPVDVVRTQWLDPFKTWRVSVPYVRAAA